MLFRIAYSLWSEEVLNQLVVDALYVHRGINSVIENLSFSASSRIIKILGKNGSGKTSFLLGISGLISISSGTINLLGEIKRSSRRERCGVYSDAITLPSYLSVEEVLSVCHIQKSDRLKEFKEEFLCDIHSCAKVSDLSEGQRRKVAIVCALFKENGVLLLDEPFNALDENSSRALIEHLSDYSGMLIYASHNSVSFSEKETEVML
ncbi:ABC transporter ATP-binding protein [Microbulbifer sp. JMSA008]|uniref:ABC transporter ATP-binding protein n=1 Tax=unclassified Microbulbifer TaxID=2619833 RepID=UPI00403AAD3C